MFKVNNNETRTTPLAVKMKVYMKNEGIHKNENKRIKNKKQKK